MTPGIASVLADHTGAVVAGGASSLGALAFAAGQVPIPPGVPVEVVWAAVTFGPPLAWLGVAILRATASYHVTRRLRAQARADKLLEAGRPVDDDDVERHLDAADRHASWASALGQVSSDVAPADKRPRKSA
jgi:hypothetical protein